MKTYHFDYVIYDGYLNSIEIWFCSFNEVLLILVARFSFNNQFSILETWKLYFDSVCLCNSIICFMIGDCHDTHGHKGRCVTAAIYNYTMQLESAHKEITSEIRCKHRRWLTLCLYTFRTNVIFVHMIFSDNLTEALMFLSHFIGDVHQVCSCYRSVLKGAEINWKYEVLDSWNWYNCKI